MELTSIVSGQIQQPSLTETPYLDKLVLHGNALQADQRTSLEFLYHFFCENNEQLPVAQITAQVDLLESNNKKWIRADPVLLHADLASLLLFDSQKISIVQDDADEIISMLNQFLKSDGLKLVYGKNCSRWYLEIDEDKYKNPLLTVSTKIVNGQDIGQYLPQGKDSAYWIQLNNEIQMLLHESPINQRRQQRGDAPINSVWFWGHSPLVARDIKLRSTKFDSIVSNDVNAIGLAKAAGIFYESIPADFEHWLAQQEKNRKILLVLSDGDLAVSEADKYSDWLTDQDDNIYKIVLENIKKGRVKKLEIKAEDSHCTVKRSHLYRFWRKEKTT